MSALHLPAVQPTTPQPRTQCYGTAGQAVHDVLLVDSDLVADVQQTKLRDDSLGNAFLV